MASYGSPFTLEGDPNRLRRAPLERGAGFPRKPAGGTGSAIHGLRKSFLRLWSLRESLFNCQCACDGSRRSNRVFKLGLISLLKLRLEPEVFVTWRMGMVWFVIE